MRAFTESIGRWFIHGTTGTGRAAILLGEATSAIQSGPHTESETCCVHGVCGGWLTFVVMLTGLFTGAVFAPSGCRRLRLFNAESLVGPTVGLSLARELSPVLTG